MIYIYSIPGVRHSTCLVTSTLFKVRQQQTSSVISLSLSPVLWCLWTSKPICLFFSGAPRLLATVSLRSRLALRHHHSIPSQSPPQSVGLHFSAQFLCRRTQPVLPRFPNDLDWLPNQQTVGRLFSPFSECLLCILSIVVVVVQLQVSSPSSCPCTQQCFDGLLNNNNQHQTKILLFYLT